MVLSIICSVVGDLAFDQCGQHDIQDAGFRPSSVLSGPSSGCRKRLAVNA
jgi:hypothetical protein